MAQKIPPASNDDADSQPRRSFLSLWQGRLHTEMVWFDGFLRRWARRGIFLTMHVTFLVIACYLITWAIAHGKTYDRLGDVPPRTCGLVLGCAPKVGSFDNTFFTRRIKAAADLYEEGKLQFLIVSGDNSRNGYDEPTAMKAALVAKGVPASRIYCDYAGLRTLDSVIRARKIFGQVEFTLISQKYHNERALYMARRLVGDGCVAYNAADPVTSKMFKAYVREAFARVMAILDVEVLKTEPKFLGEKVPVGEKTPPVDAAPKS
jgi:SanA protein